MNIPAPLLVDISLALIFVCSVMIGARRGAFRAIAGIFGSVLAAAGAFTFAATAAPFVARAISPLLKSAVRAAAGERIDMMHQLLQPVADTTREIYADLLRLLHIPESALGGLVESAQASQEHMLTAACDALAAQIAPVFAFILLFFALKLAIGLAARLLSADIPIISTINKLSGALFGAVSGILIVVLLTWAVVRLAPDNAPGGLTRQAVYNSHAGGFIANILGFGPGDTL